ncbi:MAG: FGGY family carbohydrate kinase, partial [Chloroflexia bacterium]
MPTSDGYILAIDQGTTGTTVLVFNHEGLVQCRAYSEFTQHFPRPGWVEHDAQEIWSVGIGVVEAALRDGGLQPSEVTAIGITNQRETTVLWDRETGEPVARAIVWQDRRTADTIEELKRRDLGDLFKDKTGLLLDPYFSGTKIKWYLDNLDGLRDRCERGEIAFGTIDSWLVWKLTGGAEHATDYSNASRTLLYNIHSLEWDAELLEILSVPEAILPRVAPSSGLVGETDPQAFFGRRVPIAGIAGDQQAALFGQACYGEGLAKNTYGTG